MTYAGKATDTQSCSLLGGFPAVWGRSVESSSSPRSPSLPVSREFRHRGRWSHVSLLSLSRPPGGTLAHSKGARVCRQTNRPVPNVPETESSQELHGEGALFSSRFM